MKSRVHIDFVITAPPHFLHSAYTGKYSARYALEMASCVSEANQCLGYAIKRLDRKHRICRSSSDWLKRQDRQFWRKWIGKSDVKPILRVVIADLSRVNKFIYTEITIRMYPRSKDVQDTKLIAADIRPNDRVRDTISMYAKICYILQY